MGFWQNYDSDNRLKIIIITDLHIYYFKGDKMKDKLPINSLEYMEHNVGYDSKDKEIFLKFRNLYNFWIRSNWQ